MKNEPITPKVWNPPIIGILAFIPDYTVGAFLAAINAHRLGERAKRNLYLLVSLPYIAIFWLGGFFMMDGWFVALSLFVRAGLGYWLYTDSKKLLEQHADAENIEDEKLGKLLLIGVGFLVVTGLCYLIFAILMMTFNSQ